MKQLRKEDLSLYRYISDVALVDFIEKEEMSELEAMPEMCGDGVYVYQAKTSQTCEIDSDMVPTPTDYGRGWLFFDCSYVDADGYCVTASGAFTVVSGTDAHGNVCYGTPEQSNRVVVYDDALITLSGTEYLIDYIDGRLVFGTNTVIPAYVDYYWNYVSVLDEWPSGMAPSPPIVVIDIDQTQKEGYQLGAGKHVRRKANLHIFATSASERNDLTETLYDALYLKCAPVYDFPTGDVLDVDGTFYGRKENTNKLTSLFNRTTLNDLNVLHGGMTFHDIKSRNIKTQSLLEGTYGTIQASDLNAFRSTISFEIQTYTRT